jgi:hypothetical protein
MRPAIARGRLPEPHVLSPAIPHEVEAFIDRWRGVAVLPGSTELATAQSFVLDLCGVLGGLAPEQPETGPGDTARPAARAA